MTVNILLDDELFFKKWLILSFCWVKFIENPNILWNLGLKVYTPFVMQGRLGISSIYFLHPLIRKDL